MGRATKTSSSPNPILTDRAVKLSLPCSDERQSQFVQLTAPLSDGWAKRLTHTMREEKKQVQNGNKKAKRMLVSPYNSAGCAEKSNPWVSSTDGGQQGQEQEPRKRG